VGKKNAYIQPAKPSARVSFTKSSVGPGYYDPSDIQTKYSVNATSFDKSPSRGSGVTSRKN